VLIFKKGKKRPRLVLTQSQLFFEVDILNFYRTSI